MKYLPLLLSSTALALTLYTFLELHSRVNAQAGPPHHIQGVEDSFKPFVLSGKE